MHQPSLASSLLDKVNTIFRASKEETSEWTTKGKRRKHNRKRPISSASSAKIARSRNDDYRSDAEGSDEINEFDHDRYYGLVNNELKDILRARGLKVIIYLDLNCGK